MAKILYVIDNTNLSKNNVGDVIATYPDDVRIYTRDELLNLAEVFNLRKSITEGDEKMIEEDIIALVKAISTQEQYQIMTGLFGLMKTEKTLSVQQAELNALHPTIKQMWQDPTTREWKELIEVPKAALKYDGTNFVSNISEMPVNATKVNATTTAEVSKI
jgi:hypothetical protein